MTTPAAGRHLHAVPDLPDLPAALGEVGDSTVELMRGGVELRIELDDIEPPIWRRFRVPANIALDDLHLVVQAVMGWEDRHLHQWTRDNDPRARGLTSYKPTYAFADWETDEDERDEAGVPLATLLTRVGDTLFYRYDFGDCWDHRLTVEAITAAARRPECLAGERACPPEDCGGTTGYELLLAVRADPDHPDRDWLAGHADAVDPELFDVDAVNDRLDIQSRATRVFGVVAHVSPLVATVTTRLTPTLSPDFSRALIDCRLDEPIDEIPSDAALLLDAMGVLIRHAAAGITLTKSGYLPPSVVGELRSLIPGTIGESNREVDHYQVTMLREYTRDMGLARVLKGRYVATKLGSRCAADPNLLWRTVAERFPLGKSDADHDYGVLELVLVAGGVVDRAGPVAHTMSALGWRAGDPRDSMGDAYSPTRRFFALLGVERPWKWSKLPPPTLSPTVRALARTALLTHR
ncbi:plasmid pRiA4b ORF-3 family protein [Gordonia polyisoprenivorans]|uniref:plasmid pRiA4b ORF-3 family protein n=1 Tax=Gordonia polyisoprenivorans TaxID=84595 RepID=UPI001AD72F06|nr:plasmid pRiA4b ORF-3 family protein [Gordonia polyisoprenivorans]QTI68918.1 plasmid pRiA4b ORF-3 family protein [Gordonia polyisoprenivorans]